MAAEIPADIMKTAEETLDTVLCNCAESCGGTDGLRAASIQDIAKAIHAERLRCQIAAAAPIMGHRFPHQMFIVEAIRNPVEPSDA